VEYLNKGNGSTRSLSGASLAQRLRGLTPQQRAVLAADIIDGRVALLELTAKSVTALCGANTAYVAAALACSAEECDRVRRGRGRLPKRARRWPVDWAAAGDVMLLEAIRKAGLDRTLDAAVAVERAN
jgi:hypothetical protein